MTIILKNTSEKTYEMRMTKNPITNPQQSPRPTGKSLDELDPKSATYVNDKNAILKHPNYSESKVIYLEPGINKFENNEHAEYLYQTLGQPDDAGKEWVGQTQVQATPNHNFVIEVNEKGEEIRTNLWNKYRKQKGVQKNYLPDID